MNLDNKGTGPIPGSSIKDERLLVKPEERLDQIKEIDREDIKEPVKVSGTDIKKLFNSGKMAEVPDERKQEIMGEILLAKRSALLQDLQDKGEPEPAKPDLAFERVEPNGKFSIHFNQGLSGLDFITEMGVEVKASGSVSDIFADDSDSPGDALQVEQQAAGQSRNLQELTGSIDPGTAPKSGG